MEKEDLSRYLWIISKNFWLSHVFDLLLSGVFLIIAPLIFGINDLESAEAARLLEQYTAIIGIFLLTPIFRPEGQKDIREVIESKYTPQTGIYLVRILMAVLTMAAYILIFILWLKANNSTLPVVRYAFGTFATAFFLGSLGLLAYGISDQIILGYMAPFIYILFNVFTGSRYVQNLYLYSLRKGSFQEKYWLLASAILMVVLTLVIKWVHSKRR